ncbi:Gfo/Idh/MocA family oxidoreductase [Tamlana fucoidanivorans]|uniref:Gfo/Idh/MocA family oxidoreductase n=1 Tax=Allotamlana fucoidanivorans TaxID=2583814 RepID=A0A5C4SPP4_9FLAO|nr:Gfo/Idh/MocA family oxidoreductase [Tamlana fucoidanivorans]TNJ46228.1 Gfo/Idh/MocA family oxidoreductase [Tamlana fucoidanivorans]
MTKSIISRRLFVKKTAIASAGFAVLPSLLSVSPNNKLNIAVIGVGNRGGYNLKMVSESNNIVALCDVDRRFLEQAALNYPKAKTFKDFRQMFDNMNSEIDAVVISTPDHTHFAATMAAMELGKHVYVEKPLAHNIWQLRTLKKAAKYYGVVSQMGNQGHTTEGIRLIKEWYDADVLGEVKEVHAWRGVNRFEPGYYFTKPGQFPPEEDAIPDYLDWDLWLGPAKKRPFNSAYAPKSWRGFYDFGLGQLGDWACHTLDAPFWALNLGSPHKVKAEVPKGSFNHEGFMPDRSTVVFDFKKRDNKPAVKLTWHEGYKKPNIKIKPEWGIQELNPKGGMLMIGSKRTLITGARPEKPKLLVSEDEWAAFLKDAPSKTIPRVGNNQPHKEWLDAIKDNTLPGSNFDYAANLTEMALVGVMAQRFGGVIKFDAENLKVTNKPELDVFLKEPVRDGWAYGDNLN